MEDEENGWKKYRIGILGLRDLSNMPIQMGGKKIKRLLEEEN